MCTEPHQTGFVGKGSDVSMAHGQPSHKISLRSSTEDVCMRGDGRYGGPYRLPLLQTSFVDELSEILWEGWPCAMDKMIKLWHRSASISGSRSTPDPGKFPSLLAEAALAEVCAP